MKLETLAVIILLLLLVLPPFFGVPFQFTIVIVVLLVAVGLYRFARSIFRRPIVGLEALIGHSGKAVTPLSPEGRVNVDGEVWNANAEGGPIEVGAKIVVKSHTGLKLHVRKEQI